MQIPQGGDWVVHLLGTKPRKVVTSFFFKDFFFLMWTIFKVFTEFVTILLLFYVLFFFGC